MLSFRRMRNFYVVAADGAAVPRGPGTRGGPGPRGRSIDGIAVVEARSIPRLDEGQRHRLAKASGRRPGGQEAAADADAQPAARRARATASPIASPRAATSA